jgi:predicted ArsR family transcriptional regulator
MQKRESETEEFGSSLTDGEKFLLLQSLTARIGYMSEAEQREDGWHVQFIVYNCTFKEILHDKASITCKIHTVFLKTGRFKRCLLVCSCIKKRRC